MALGLLGDVNASQASVVGVVQTDFQDPFLFQERGDSVSSRKKKGVEETDGGEVKKKGKKGKQQKKSEDAKGSAAGRNKSKCAEYMSAQHQEELAKRKLAHIFKSNGPDFAREWAKSRGLGHLLVAQEERWVEKITKRRVRHDIKRAIKKRDPRTAAKLAKDHDLVPVIEAMTLFTNKGNKKPSRIAKIAQEALVVIRTS